MKALTLGLVVGNRGFFPSHLCQTGRAAMLAALRRAGVKVTALGPGDTEHGSIESLADARKCAQLFRDHAEELAGVVVTLPNFGDERAVANALRWSGLKVPVLVHAFPDEPGKMTVEHRRDSFCGKMSVCNNLKQYGIPFTLMTRHTIAPEEAGFQSDLARFLATCRVVRGMKGLRIGALGARPAAFNTVRYSEKLLEAAGISVETLDLSEAFGRAAALSDRDRAVQTNVRRLKNYVNCANVPEPALLRMAKFAVVADRWTADCGLNATAVQCWTSMEQYFGVVPCAVMSMLSHGMAPSACEVDVPGVVGMWALAQATGEPSALVDWNNNYGEDPDKGVFFHCSNLPKNFFESARMDYQAIIAGSVGRDNAYGTVVGRIKPGPFTFLRVTTRDGGGCRGSGGLSAYVGEGEFTGDKLETFGGYGVFKVRNLQKLLRFICENGYEHHVAVNPARAADAVAEALGKYLGWDVHRHE